jgi:hypothetical protein
MNMTLKKLHDRLENDCVGSEDYVRCIGRIARTRSVDAIPILASLLDSPGPIGAAAIEALVGLGDAVIAEMKRCADSLDSDMVAQAHEVLERVARHSTRAA